MKRDDLALPSEEHGIRSLPTLPGAPKTMKNKGFHLQKNLVFRYPKQGFSCFWVLLVVIKQKTKSQRSIQKPSPIFVLPVLSPSRRPGRGQANQWARGLKRTNLKTCPGSPPTPPCKRCLNGRCLDQNMNWP